MYRYFLILTLLFFSLPAMAQFEAVKKNISQKPVQDLYMSHLTEKGYNPEIDQDGDIKFTYNKRSYYITIDLNDKNFFRVARLANLQLTDEAKIARAKTICHEVTKDAKVTKVYWSNGQIWASSEQILGKPEDFQAILDRTLKLTESAYLKFVSAWKDAGQ